MRIASRGKPPPAKPSWASYRQSIGDRSSLFAAVASEWGSQRALYLGSYLDLAPSTAIPSVTYVDTDRRAKRYFEDQHLVAEDLKGRTLEGAGAEVEFLQADFKSDLPLSDSSFDLLISLYTVPALDNCLRYLKPQGLLLANTSHGEASLAALDPRLELVAAVLHKGDEYRLKSTDLDAFLIPKKPATADPDLIRSSGRGVAYTRSAFAYLFQLK